MTSNAVPWMVRREGRRRLMTMLLALITAFSGLAFGVEAPRAQAQTVSDLQLNVYEYAYDANGYATKVGATPVDTYRYLINVDNTGDPFDPVTDCSPDNPGYPDSCDWASIREVPSHSPIYTQGRVDPANPFAAIDMTLPVMYAEADGTVNDVSTGKFLVSVQADGYKTGGAHFTLDDLALNVGVVDVYLHPDDLPSSTIRIKVFDDNASVNGQFDAAAGPTGGEAGLEFFRAIINDTLGPINTDVFGNSLCTVYNGVDAEGSPIPVGISEYGCVISDDQGNMVIPNMGPLRYDVLVNPPPGTDWIETTTLEGSPSWDTWLSEGGNGLDNEFVIAGEPFPWTIFGFTHPTGLDTGTPGDGVGEPIGADPAGGSLTGTLIKGSVYLPQQGALPYYGDIWTGFSGTKAGGVITDGWVALSSLQAGADPAVYVQRAASDGTFDIQNIPAGDYLFTWWDSKLHYILDWIQVTIEPGKAFDMGTPMLTGWFTEYFGYIFEDTNGNGVRDPGEQGVPNFNVVLRDRDNSEIDRMSIASTSDGNGFYELEKGYPMTSWMILEAYDDRYYTTGVTYQVENQPEPTTILGQGVDVSVMPVLGQKGRLDWGVKPYDPTGEKGLKNGGIVGTVSLDVTRAELDPRFAGLEPWQPGVGGLTVNLYAPVPCGTTAAACDAAGRYELNGSGGYAFGDLLGSQVNETWHQPAGCTPRDAYGVPLRPGVDENVLPRVGSTGGVVYDLSARCLEGPLVGTQFANEYAALDGNWGFGEIPDGAGGMMPITAGDYLVQLVIPDDPFGNPLYRVTQEEDINMFDGDSYFENEPGVLAIPPSACAGDLHTVDVAGVGPDGPGAVVNPNFVAEFNGSIYEGQDRPLCDVKLVTLKDGSSIAPAFTVFPTSDVPVPGRWKGYIINDLAISSNKNELFLGEKAPAAELPIGVYDWNNQLVTTIVSDPNGTYDTLLPSTNTVNCPSPSGVCSASYYILGNDPGPVGALNPQYNPQFRTIGATFEIYPGLIIPSDLAPTQNVIGVLAAGTQYGEPPQCALNDLATPDIFTEVPEIWAVSDPVVTIWAARTGRAPRSATITIDGVGFGPTEGSVFLDGIDVESFDATTDDVIWDASGRHIDVTIPASFPAGKHQLSVWNVSSGETSVNGVTMHVRGRIGWGNGANYTPQVREVGPGRAFDPGNYPNRSGAIQAAIDSARTNNAIVNVFPDLPTAPWNSEGIYFENIVLSKNITIQGVGPGGIYPDGTPVLGTVIDGRGVAGDTGYAQTWRNTIFGLDWDGPQIVYEGPTVYVVAKATGGTRFRYRDTWATAGIDGFRLQGGDQQGFPNNQPPANVGTKALGSVQGGAIYLNAYARDFRITNNVVRQNGGAYGTIRLGTPNLQGADADAHNTNVKILNNRILANGGVNLAGAVGIFNGADGYEIAGNDLCGNYSAEYGGGISHFGFSPGGSIHDNRIYFNRSYDEGGGVMIAGELPAPNTLSPGAGEVSVYNNLIQANLSNDDGGGLRFLMAGNFHYDVHDNIIANNISTHEGGGVSLNDTPDVAFYNNTVVKNLTTATAVTSTGAPAPAGLSTSHNSAELQASLPPGAPVFSDPEMFNNLFWDNRAGAFTGSTVAGIGLPGDPTPISNWDMGVTGPGGQTLSPTYTLMQVATGVTPDGTNIVGGTAPTFVAEFDNTVDVLPWRGNPRFIDTVMVTATADPNSFGDYHLTAGSAGINAGTAAGAALTDIDGEPRPDPTSSMVDMGADEVQ